MIGETANSPLSSGPAASRLRFRLRRLRSAAPSPPFAFPQPHHLLLLGAWFGLLTGLGELALLALRRALFSQSTLGTLQLNRHFIWMIPLADLAIGLSLGLCLAILAIIHRKSARAAALPALLGLSALTWLLTIHGLHPLAALILAAGLALRSARWLSPRCAGLLRIARWSFPCLVGLAFSLAAINAALLSARASSHHLPPPKPGAQNLILIVLDTVRADRMSLYGYARNTTPRLSDLARQGITFELARSASPWTLPSHATIFTGRWPHELAVGEHQPLDGRFPTLAEHLRDHGYATTGIVANMYYCNSWFGLDRGFTHYQDYYERDLVSPFEIARNSELGQRILQFSYRNFQTRPGLVAYRKEAAAVNRDALAWLDKRASARPFFLFLNYMDTHDPYVLPDGVAWPDLGRTPSSQSDLDTLHQWHGKSRLGVTPEEKQLASDAYDACLSYLDTQLGLLVDQLHQRGLLENTWLVITSDHGEHFGEHDLYLHGNSLYRPLIDVPLLILPPRPQNTLASRVSTPVSLRDIPLTISSLLGLSQDAPFPGFPLDRLWSAQPGISITPSAPSYPTPLLSEVDLGIKPSRKRSRPARAPASRGPMEALLFSNHTYHRLGDGSEELYNLSADPAETANQAANPDSEDSLQHARSQRVQSLHHSPQ